MESLQWVNYSKLGSQMISLVSFLPRGNGRQTDFLQNFCVKSKSSVLLFCQGWRCPTDLSIVYKYLLSCGAMVAIKLSEC